jgi:hypothetical protein
LLPIVEGDHFQLLVMSVVQPADLEKDARDDASPSPVQPSPVITIPNGGVIAWLQVAGAFTLFLNSWYV